jgi:hypothetical protein
MQQSGVPFVELCVTEMFALLGENINKAIQCKLKVDYPKMV